MLMGDVCTRHCGFCAVTQGAVRPLDPEEPRHVAEAVRELGVRHAVVTSVNRDELPDGGAAHFAATIRAVRALNPGVTVEVLIPDFLGRRGGPRDRPRRGARGPEPQHRDGPAPLPARAARRGLRAVARAPLPRRGVARRAMRPRCGSRAGSWSGSGRRSTRCSRRCATSAGAGDRRADRRPVPAAAREEAPGGTLVDARRSSRRSRTKGGRWDSPSWSQAHSSARATTPALRSPGPDAGGERSRPALSGRCYSPSFPIASTGQESIASWHCASSSGVSACFDDVRVALLFLPAEVVRSRHPADVAVDALRVDVELPGRVVAVAVVLVRHGRGR